MMRSIAEFVLSVAMLAVVAALGLLVGLGIGAELGMVQEDDALWNCKIMGNWNCGPDSPWHGFTNAFTHADNR